jgi:hypothetical protein
MADMTPEEYFGKWQQQMERSRHMQPSKADLNKESLEQQRILNEVRQNVPPAAAPTQGQCPQCKSYHPPLAPGEKCPNAKVEVKGMSEVNVNEFVVKVRDILASQMEQKEVKDIKKFTSGMVIALMKYCEEYKEDK